MNLILCDTIAASIMDGAIRLVCTIMGERAVVSIKDGRLKYAYTNGQQSRRLLGVLIRSNNPEDLIKKACISRASHCKLNVDTEDGKAVAHFIGEHVHLQVASKKHGLLAIVSKLTNKKEEKDDCH